MKNIFVILLFGILLIAGCAASGYKKEDVLSAKPESTKKSVAYEMCTQMAEKCVSTPIASSNMQLGCLGLEQYSSNSKDLLEYAQGMAKNCQPPGE